MASLHLGSTWRSRPECLGASSMGFDLARDRHHSLCSGRRAYRVGLAAAVPQAFRPVLPTSIHSARARESGRAARAPDKSLASPESQPRPHFSQIVKERSASDSRTVTRGQRPSSRSPSPRLRSEAVALPQALPRAGIACWSQAGRIAEYTNVGSPSMSASLSRLIPIFMATLADASFAGSIRQIKRGRRSSPKP